MTDGLYALVHKYDEPHAICAHCARPARFVVTRHDGSGRTTSCTPHLDRAMKPLHGITSLVIGMPVRRLGWRRLGVIRGRHIDPARTVADARVDWEDGTDSLESVADLVPAHDA